MTRLEESPSLVSPTYWAVHPRWKIRAFGRRTGWTTSGTRQPRPDAASTGTSLDPTAPEVDKDAVEAARQLFQQPCGSDELESDDGADASDDSADGGSTDSPTGGAQPTGPLPSGSSMLSLRVRPTQTARADKTVSTREVYAAVSVNPEKMLIHKAKKEPDWEEVDASVRDGVDSLWRNGTWELVHLP